MKTEKLKIYFDWLRIIDYFGFYKAIRIQYAFLF